MFTSSNTQRREYQIGWLRAMSIALPAVFVLSSFAMAAEEQPGEAALKAVITQVTGASVQFSPKTGAAWQKAKVGDELTMDATIRTGFASGCELTFGEHTVLQIEALSAVRVADYSKVSDDKEKVDANVQYGAVRCGVEKGRIKAETKISTPVSTLSIRGTLVYVEFDRGTRSCLLRVEQDGPAMAYGGKNCEGCQKDEPKIPGQTSYALEEGMRTDCSLSRYLRTAIFDRNLQVTGDAIVAESESAVYNNDVVDPGQGALNLGTDKSRSTGQTNPCGDDTTCFF